MSEPEVSEPDPVRQRRARVERLAAAGRRTGYACILVAVVAFAIGTATGFPTPVTTAVTASLAASALTLAPSMVAGYGVKAAEREDRKAGR